MSKVRLIDTDGTQLHERGRELRNQNGNNCRFADQGNSRLPVGGLFHPKRGTQKLFMGQEDIDGGDEAETHHVGAGGAL